MKTIEERVDEWLYRTIPVTPEGFKQRLEGALTELAADLSAEKEKELEQAASNWQDTALHFSNGMEFYRGIVRQIGEMFGGAAKTSDDGSVQEDVLALKVPELVDELIAARAEKEKEVAELREKLATLAKDYSEVVAGESEMEELTKLRAWKESQTPRTDAEIKRIYSNMELAPEFGMSLPGQIMLHAQRLESELTATRARLAELEGVVRREINYALIEAEYPCNRHSGEGCGMRKVAERIQKAIKAYKEGKK